MISDHEIASVVAKLIGEPVYIAAAADVDVMPPGPLAFTGRTLDLAMRPHLKKQRRWDGRRPAIAIDRDAIRRYTARCHGYTETDVTRATVIHEVGHIAERGVDRSEPTEKAETIARSFAAFSAAILPKRESPEVVKAIGTAHGPAFARLSVHVAYRARQLGWGCSPELIYSGEQYGLPEPDRVESSLRNEPEAIAYMPLLEISSIQPPRSFEQLSMNLSRQMEQS